MDIDESDNKDTGADAEDEEMASQEEQHDEGGVRERIPATPTPVDLAPASTYTPTGDKKRKAARPAHADSDVIARAVVQEPYDLPNVQIRHRSRVAHALYAPIDQPRRRGG